MNFRTLMRFTSWNITSKNIIGIVVYHAVWWWWVIMTETLFCPTWQSLWKRRDLVIVPGQLICVIYSGRDIILKASIYFVLDWEKQWIVSVWCLLSSQWLRLCYRFSSWFLTFNFYGKKGIKPPSTDGWNWIEIELMIRVLNQY